MTSPSGALPATRLHTRTRPSIPPVATISPSKLQPAATTESVCPVSLVAGNESVLHGYNTPEGPSTGGMGQKMNARSSSPPEIASGGLGKAGWSESVKMDCCGSCRAVRRQRGTSQCTVNPLKVNKAPRRLTACAPAVVLLNHLILHIPHHLLLLARHRRSNDNLPVVFIIVVVIVVHRLVALILDNLDDVLLLELVLAVVRLVLVLVLVRHG